MDSLRHAGVRGASRCVCFEEYNSLTNKTFKSPAAQTMTERMQTITVRRLKVEDRQCRVWSYTTYLIFHCKIWKTCCWFLTVCMQRGKHVTLSSNTSQSDPKPHKKSLKSNALLIAGKILFYIFRAISLACSDVDHYKLFRTWREETAKFILIPGCWSHTKWAARIRLFAQKMLSLDSDLIQKGDLGDESGQLLASKPDKKKKIKKKVFTYLNAFCMFWLNS